MIYFISGHRDISNDEFEKFYIPKLNDLLKDNNNHFVVGECDGCDIMAQEYLYGKTKNVTVFHRGINAKNNIGFEVSGGYEDHIERDTAMTIISDIDLAWIRNIGENSGTEQNIIRRQELK